jgi:N utilization substance protein B
MKSAQDPRHKNRQRVVRELYTYGFTLTTDISSEAKKVIKELPEIDKKIQKAAPAWPVDRINRVDLAVLRLAVYELIHEDAPKKVIIDEAVELAKEYGAESSPPFVNGVLGAIV